MEKTKPISQQAIETALLTEIIQSLQRLGGVATKMEIYDDLQENASMIPEDYILLKKVSRKTRNLYRPFDYNFNFSTKQLIAAKLLERPARATYQLTPVGADLTDFSDFPHTIHSLQAQETLLPHEEATPSFEETSPQTSWQDELLASLREFSPARFEQFCRLLVRKMGVTMDEKIGVQVSNDGGLDGFGYITSPDDFRTNRVAIQAKRWQGNVQSPEIDKFRGAMDKYNAEYGIFVTTASFSRGAIQAARQGTRVITLIDGDKITELVAKYKLHVTEVVTYELDDYYKNKG